MKLSVVNVEVEVEKKDFYDIYYLILFCRDKKGNRKTVKVKGCRPYFYMKASDVVKLGRERGFQYKVYKSKIRSIFGDELVKVTFSRIRGLENYRNKLTKMGTITFESDVKYWLRNIIDKNIWTGIEVKGRKILPIDFRVKPRLLYLDLEVEPVKDGTFPNPLVADRGIIAVCLYDNYTQKYYQLVIEGKADTNLLKKKAKEEYGIDVEIREYETELLLILDLLDLIKELNPDVLVGYNVINFDIFYLLKRMKRLGIKLALLSPMGRTIIRKKRDVEKDLGTSDYQIIIRGIQLLDFQTAFFNYIQRELEARDLAYLIETFLNREPIRVEDWYKTWKLTPFRIFLKNIQDVWGVVEIDNLLKVLDFYQEIAWLVGARLTDVLTKSQLLDIYYLRIAREKKIALPKKLKYEKREFKGAKVLFSNTGLYRDVARYDLKAFYPTCMLCFNISVDTVLDYPLDQKTRYIEIGGLFFSQEKSGFFKEILERLMSLEDEKKKILKRVRREDRKKALEMEIRAIKYIRNAVYGMTAYTKSRLFDFRVAEIVTYLGRSILLHIKNTLEEKGWKIIYGDTDSVLIPLKEKTLEEAKRLEDEINKIIEGYVRQYGVESKFKIKLETLFSDFILFTKKRYAGKYVWKDGEWTVGYEFKGLQTERSDFPRYFKKTQKELIKMILDRREKQEILDYVYDSYFNLRKQRFIELGIPKQLKKDIDEYSSNPFHVQGVKYSNQYLGYQFRKGDKPLILPVKIPFHTRKPYTKWIAITHSTSSLPSYIQIDYERLEKGFERILREIMDVVGLEWGRVFGLERWLPIKKVS